MFNVFLVIIVFHSGSYSLPSQSQWTHLEAFEPTVAIASQWGHTRREETYSYCDFPGIPDPLSPLGPPMSNPIVIINNTSVKIYPIRLNSYIIFIYDI